VKKSPPGLPLVSRVATGWIADWLLADEWLDQFVAGPHGTLGKGDARRARFDRERQARAARPLLEAIQAELRRFESGAQMGRLSLE
jgi:hypothetical protein